MELMKCWSVAGIPAGPRQEQTRAFVTVGCTAIKLMALAGRRLIKILHQGHFQVIYAQSCILLTIIMKRVSQSCCFWAMHLMVDWYWKRLRIPWNYGYGATTSSMMVSNNIISGLLLLYTSVCPVSKSSKSLLSWPYNNKLWPTEDQDKLFSKLTPISAKADVDETQLTHVIKCLPNHTLVSRVHWIIC